MKYLFSLDSIRFFAIPVIIAFIACSQILIIGYPQGHDWLYELVRIIEYREALISDQGIPFWAGNLYHGFGSPIFIFYAPLYAASSALLMISGMSVTTAAITVLVFFTILASIGVAGLTRELIGWEIPGAESAAHVATAAFVLAPYFLADMLIRNASAEFTALCLAPYPLWGMALLFRGEEKGLPVITVTFTLVILSHNLTALVMTASLLIMTILHFLLKREVGKSISSMIAILISLGLSAWFWMPALLLKKFVRIDEMLLGKFDYHQNFIPVLDMFSYRGLFAIGWLPPLIIFLCMVVVVSGNRGPLLKVLLCAILVLIFLQTSASKLIWENIPFLPLFQFPWRLMGPLSLLIAIVSGLIFNIFYSHFRSSLLIIFILLFVNAIPLLHRYRPVSSEYITMNLNHSIIREQGLSATVGDEYLPRTAMRQLSDVIPPSSGIFNMSDNIDKVTPVHLSNNLIKVETESGEPGQIHVARWYFQGWHATVNGKNQFVSQDENGAIRINVPEGKQQIKVWLSQPDLRKLGFLISGISLAISILYIFKLQISKLPRLELNSD